jgi:hypothetical protein
MVRTPSAGGSALDKWMQELRKQHSMKKHGKPAVAPAPKPKAPEKPEAKPAAPKRN